MSTTGQMLVQFASDSDTRLNGFRATFFVGPPPRRRQALDAFSFGYFSSAGDVAISIGGVPCAFSKYSVPNTIECITGVGQYDGTYSVSLTLGNSVSSTSDALFTWEGPTVTAVSPSNAPTDQRFVVLTIAGTNFGVSNPGTCLTSMPCSQCRPVASRPLMYTITSAATCHV